ncbi:hypothetical protein FRB99_006234 [Tulasnella sp. 403]|nr:hypothetical protein FRB99_006234 [Tulasnella sp. 403]
MQQAPSAQSTAAINSGHFPPTPHVPTNPPSPPPTHLHAIHNLSKTPVPPAPPAHPSGRWETLYVYAFLVKFLPPKVDDLYDAMGFEEALLAPGFNQILFDTLVKFLHMLRPERQEFTTPDNVDTLLKSILVQFCKSKERTVWWDDNVKANIHPFVDTPPDFFALSWQDRLAILRQLVDWQLTHSSVKDVIDVAWEVKYQRKKKKTNKTLAAEFAPPDADDPMSLVNLRMIPIGQDTWRVRYWMIDDSPRVWTSPNPWRMNCPVTAASSNRDEFNNFVEQIKTSVPPPPPHGKRPKYQLAHHELISVLESKSSALDTAEKVRPLLATPSNSQIDQYLHQTVLEEKRSRAAAKQREEEARLLALQEEERRKREVGSRTRSKTKPDHHDLPADESGSTSLAIDSIDTAHEGRSRSKAKAKSRTSNANSSRRTSTKRKRAESPGPPINPDEIDELAEDDSPVDATPKAGRQTKGRGADGKDISKSLPPLDKKGGKARGKVDTDQIDQDIMATSEPPRPRQRRSSRKDQHLVKEEVEGDSDAASVPPSTLEKHKASKSSATKRETTADSSVQPTSSKPPPTRPVGSRRSVRLAKTDLTSTQLEGRDLDQDPTSTLIPPMQASTLTDPPTGSSSRKSTSTTSTRQRNNLRSRHEVPSPSSSANVLPDEMDIDVEAASSTKVTTTPETIPSAPLPKEKTDERRAPKRRRASPKFVSMDSEIGGSPAPTIINGWAVQPNSSENELAAAAAPRICA